MTNLLEVLCPIWCNVRLNMSYLFTSLFCCASSMKSKRADLRRILSKDRSFFDDDDDDDDDDEISRKTLAHSNDFVHGA